MQNKDLVDNHIHPLNASSDRNFGLVFAVFFLVIALLPLLSGDSLRYWPIAISLILAITSFTLPVILAPLNRRWAKFGLLMHATVSPIILALIFYGVVTPTGLLMRLLGKDILQLRFDRNIDTYWKQRAPQNITHETFRNQF